MKEVERELKGGLYLKIWFDVYKLFLYTCEYV